MWETKREEQKRNWLGQGRRDVERPWREKRNSGDRRRARKRKMEKCVHHSSHFASFFSPFPPTRIRFFFLSRDGCISFSKNCPKIPSLSPTGTLALAIWISAFRDAFIVTRNLHFSLFYIYIEIHKYILFWCIALMLFYFIFYYLFFMRFSCDENNFLYFKFFVRKSTILKKKSRRALLLKRDYFHSNCPIGSIQLFQLLILLINYTNINQYLIFVFVIDHFFKEFFQSAIFSRVSVYFLTLCVCVKILIKSLFYSIVEEYLIFIEFTQLFVEKWLWNECNCLYMFFCSLKCIFHFTFVWTSGLSPRFKMFSLHFLESENLYPLLDWKEGKQTGRKEGRKVVRDHMTG